MICTCATPERRTPYRVRLSYFSTPRKRLWTVFRLDENQHGAGHDGYFAVRSLPTWAEAIAYLKEIAT